MRLFCIACEVLARPLYLCAARSPHIVDIRLYRRGLHNNPADLRQRLQAEVNEVSALANPDGQPAYDAIVMGYGLCGQAVAGLTARALPVIIPRAHDCITLFLGSREKYNYQFEHFTGTYWYEQDYVERDDGSNGSLALGSGSDVELDSVYDEYVQKYGKENADYLMEVMGAWQKHYKRAAVIDMGAGETGAAIARAERDAARRGWSVDVVAGDMVLVRRLLEGDWAGEKDDFLVLQPGEQVKMTFDNRVIDCAANVERG